MPPRTWIAAISCGIMQALLLSTGVNSWAQEIPASGARSTQRTDQIPLRRPQVAAVPAPAVSQPQTPIQQSSPNPPPTMPNLIGMTCQEAQLLIRRALHALLQCAPGGASGLTRPGLISRQFPLAGSPVAPGTGVQPRALIEREAPATVSYRVPDLRGTTCAEARRLVLAAGHRELICTDSPGPVGRIYRQAPTAGSQHPEPALVRAWLQAVEITVPDVRGQAGLDAANVLQKLGLAPELNGPAAVTGRRVVGQSPSGGTPVQPGSKVLLTLGLTVPSLLGVDCSRAQQLARDYGFPDVLCERRVAGPEQEVNRVFQQAPKAGSVLSGPQPLTVVIAEPVPVPNVVGLPLGKAMAMLGNGRLTGQPDAEDGDREVKTQRPEQGEHVAPRSVVALTTQRFEIVPPVVNMSLPEALAALRGARLGAAPDHRERASARKVDHQKPEAGTRVETGHMIEMVTHVEVPVPGVIGLRLPEAMAALSKVGLSGTPDREDHPEDRTVQSQSPERGTSIPENSDVSLVTLRSVMLAGLKDQTCKDAAQKARQEGIVVRCVVEGALPVVLGEPIVAEDPSGPVNEGTTLVLKAVPAWWSTPLLLLLAGSATGTLAWRVVRRRDPLPTPSPDSPPVKPASPPLAWRVAPDLQPKLNVRIADIARQTSLHGQDIGWRVAGTDTAVCLRGLDNLPGAPHAIS